MEGVVYVSAFFDLGNQARTISGGSEGGFTVAPPRATVCFVPRTGSILPLLSRARASLERAYAAIIQGAEHAPVPCDAVAVYSRLRTELLRLETAYVTEARKRGIHPPEDVPRALALIGACPPRAEETQFAADQIEYGKSYVEGVQQRERLTDKAFAKAFAASPEFATVARSHLEWLGPHARAGTPEAAPAPPQNLALLRLIYYLGGSPWAIKDAESFLYLDIPVVKPEDALAIYRESSTLEQLAIAFAEEVSPPPPVIGGRGWAIIGTMTAALATVGGVAAWKYTKGSRKQETDSAEPWTDFPRDETRAAV